MYRYTVPTREFLKGLCIMNRISAVVPSVYPELTTVNNKKRQPKLKSVRWYVPPPLKGTNNLSFVRILGDLDKTGIKVAYSQKAAFFKLFMVPLICCKKRKWHVRDIKKLRFFKVKLVSVITCSKINKYSTGMRLLSKEIRNKNYNFREGPTVPYHIMKI